MSWNVYDDDYVIYYVLYCLRHWYVDYSNKAFYDVVKILKLVFLSL